MTWNYRVIRQIHKSRFGVSVSYHVHEVHYDGDHRPVSWSSDPVAPMGETLAELTDELIRFKAACRKPILEVIDGELREVQL